MPFVMAQIQRTIYLKENISIATRRGELKDYKIFFFNPVLQITLEQKIKKAHVMIFIKSCQ